MSIEYRSTFYKFSIFIEKFFIKNFKIVIFSYVPLKIDFKSKNSSKFDNCIWINFNISSSRIKIFLNYIFRKNFFLYSLVIIFCDIILFSSFLVIAILVLLVIGTSNFTIELLSADIFFLIIILILFPAKS